MHLGPLFNFVLVCNSNCNFPCLVVAVAVVVVVVVGGVVVVVVAVIVVAVVCYTLPCKRHC